MNADPRIKKKQFGMGPKLSRKNRPATVMNKY